MHLNIHINFVVIRRRLSACFVGAACGTTRMQALAPKQVAAQNTLGISGEARPTRPGFAAPGASPPPARDGRRGCVISRARRRHVADIKEVST